MFEFLAQTFVNGINIGALYGLAAVGLSLVFGVMKILNVAHGEFLMISGYVMFWLFKLGKVSPLVSIIVTAPLMFVLGLLIFKVIIMPLERVGLRHLVERGTLIACFGLLIVFQNTALVLWTADYRVATYLLIPLRFLFFNISINRIIVLGISIAIIFVLDFFLKRTYPGKAIRAITQDRDAGMLMSINAERLSLICFGLGTALAGIAGTLGGILHVITPTMGFPFLIKAFVVMIIGGLGNMKGCLYAGFLLGVLEFIGAHFIGEGYRSAIDYVILIVFLLLISHGYLRRMGRAL